MTQTFYQLRLELVSALAGFLDPEEAQAECSWWFEEGLGFSQSWMSAHGSEGVPAGVRRKVNSWMARRRKGEPWAYILGWSLFRGHRFTVTPDTLIPRPETELLVEAALDVGRRLKVDRCVDIGTGSGIIAVSLALETDWKLAASDLSPRALAVAKKNAKQLGAVIQFHEGSLLDPVPDPVGLVVANLPYVDPADQPTLRRELAFEPASALFAPDRGLALSTALLVSARLGNHQPVYWRSGPARGASCAAGLWAPGGAKPWFIRTLLDMTAFSSHWPEGLAPSSPWIGVEVLDAEIAAYCPAFFHGIRLLHSQAAR